MPSWNKRRLIWNENTFWIYFALKETELQKSLEGTYLVHLFMIDNFSFLRPISSLELNRILRQTIPFGMCDRSFYSRLKQGLDTKNILNNVNKMFNWNFSLWDMKSNSLTHQEPFLKMSSPLSSNWNSQRYNESVYTQSLERRERV